jgi:PAS domain S-box-containing protein/putative nucleotidyltransferase with HDIG domain
MEKASINILYLGTHIPYRKQVKEILTGSNESIQIIEVSQQKKLDSSLKKGPYQLILTDLNILGFKDLDILDYLQGHFPRIPIIVLLSDDHKDLLSLAAGYKGCLVLDISNLHQLSQLVHQTLNPLPEKPQSRESRLNNAIQQMSHLGSWEWTMSSRELYWSEEMYEIFGITPPVTLEKIAWIIHPEDNNKVPGGILSKLLEGAAGTWDYRIIHPDGSLRYIHEIREQVLDAQGRLIKITGITQDLSAPKRVEKAMLDSESVFRSTFENAGYGMVVLTPDGTIRRTNRAYEKTLGYAEGELVGVSIFALIHEDDRSLNHELIQQLYEGRRDRFQIVNRYLRQQSDIIFCQTIVTQVCDEQQHVTFFVGMLQDITETKHMEQALIESENKFRHLFERSADPMFIFDGKYFLDCNHAALKLLKCLTKPQIVGRSPYDFSPVFQPDGARSDVKGPEMLRQTLKKGTMHFEWLHLKGDGEKLFTEVSLTATPLHGKMVFFATWRDITEQKRAEKLQQALYHISDAATSIQNLQAFYQTVHQVISDLLPASNFYIALYDEAEQTLMFPYFVDEKDEIPPADKKYTMAELGLSLTTYLIRSGISQFIGPKEMCWLKENKEIKLIGIDSYEWLGAPLKTMDGQIIGALVMQTYDKNTNYKHDDLNILGFMAGQVAMAIERRRALDALRLNEEMFHSLFEQGPDAIFIEKADGRIVDANPAACNMLMRPHDELIRLMANDLVSPDLDANDYTVEKQLAIGKSFESLQVRKDGKRVPVEIKIGQLDDDTVISMVRDVTERKRSEKLQQAVYHISEAANTASDFSTFAETIHQIVADLIPARNLYIALYDAESGIVSFPYFVDEHDPRPLPRRDSDGATEEVIHTGKPKMISPKDFPLHFIGSYAPSWLGIPLKTADERVIGALVVQSYTPDYDYNAEDQEILTFVSAQIAMAIERKQSQERMSENELKYRTLFESSTEGFFLFNDVFLDCNEQACRLWQCTRDEIIGHHLLDFSPRFQPYGTLSSLMFQQYMEAAYGGLAQYFYWTCQFKNGTPMDVEISLKSVQVGGNPNLLMTLRDISERRRSEERIQKQLQRLAALRAIDAAISTSVDLPKTLKLVIEKTLELLHVDAGAILLLNKDSNRLDYAASSGFMSTSNISCTSLERGKGYPWNALHEQRLVVINDLMNAPNSLPSLYSENFVAYYCAPLFAKGEMRGAMELFHRTPIEPDQEWLDFMETLAGQATIALDNGFLFADLKRANDELVQAYNNTIEGWARALEIRDEESVGHSRRVTDQTVALARKMGVDESQMEHIYRGALLHDIGKMSIPDNVLKKPGPLNESEWVIMRKHPQISYDLLKDIQFLEHALDIPYFHQERWDGSGYPLGLHGEEIPLPARIFAVVDVWDALTEDRVYRLKWSEEKTARYLRNKSGIQFDPEVVTNFLELKGLDGLGDQDDWSQDDRTQAVQTDTQSNVESD